MNHSCSRVFLHPKADSAGDIKKALLYGTKRRRRQSPVRLNNIFLLPPPAGLLRGCVYACCIRSFEVPKPKKQLFPNKLPLLSRLRRQDIKQSDRRVYWPLLSPPRHSEAFIVGLYVCWQDPDLCGLPQSPPPRAFIKVVVGFTNIIVSPPPPPHSAPARVKHEIRQFRAAPSKFALLKRNMAVLRSFFYRGFLKISSVNFVLRPSHVFMPLFRSVSDVFLSEDAGTGLLSPRPLSTSLFS